MQLIFTSLDTTNQHKEFSWWFANLETICDVLNSVVAKGNQLIKAEFVDNGRRTQLPVDAFDGNSSSEGIRHLEQEWQQILSAPVCLRYVHNQRLIGFSRQQVKNHESRIAQLEQAIKALEQQRQRVQNSIIFSEPGRSILINRNEVAIQQYQQHLAIAQARQERIVNQLRQLNNSDDE